MKRRNLVELFLDSLSADQFIATHLYGQIKTVYDDLPDSLLNLALPTDFEVIEGETFARQQKLQRYQIDHATKLGTFATFIAVIKGYCSILILFIPSAFKNGGWGTTSILIAANAFITTICVLKLVASGLKLQIFSYSLLMEKTFGRPARIALDVMIALTQFSFSISHFTFNIESLKSTIDSVFETQTKRSTYAIILVAILIPVSWVRDIGRFSFAFMIGNLIIVLTLAVVVYFCLETFTHQGALGPDIAFFNPQGYLTTVGFAIYSFEGIGVVMPIMQTCKRPEKFTGILVAAIATLCLVYIVYGNLCYLTLGSNMDRPLITEMLPASEPIVIAVKLLFVVNLICSYAICVYPTNTIIESVYPHGKSKRVFWLQICSRASVVIAAAYLGLAMAKKIDKFLGLMGALLCAPLALTFPAAINYKLLATTKKEKAIDIALILFSFAVLVFSTNQSLA